MAEFTVFVDIGSLENLSKLLGVFDENLNIIARETGVLAYVENTYIGADFRRRVLDRETGKCRFLGELELDELDSSACEGVDVKGGGEAEYACDLLSRGALGVYDHTESELILYVFGLSVIFGVFDSRDYMTAAFALCHKTAEEIKLIGARYRDEKVGLFDSGLELSGVGSAVSDNSHNVELARDVLDLFCVYIYNGYVVSVGVEYLRQYRTNPVASYYNNVHMGLSPFVKRGKSIAFLLILYSIIAVCQEKSREEPPLRRYAAKIFYICTQMRAKSAVYAVYSHIVE